MRALQRVYQERVDLAEANLPDRRCYYLQHVAAFTKALEQTNPAFLDGLTRRDKKGNPLLNIGFHSVLNAARTVYNRSANFEYPIDPLSSLSMLTSKAKILCSEVVSQVNEQHQATSFRSIAEFQERIPAILEMLERSPVWIKASLSGMAKGCLRVHIEDNHYVGTLSTGELIAFPRCSSDLKSFHAQSEFGLVLRRFLRSIEPKAFSQIGSIAEYTIQQEFEVPRTSENRVWEIRVIVGVGGDKHWFVKVGRRDSNYSNVCSGGEFSPASHVITDVIKHNSLTASYEDFIDASLQVAQKVASSVSLQQMECAKALFSDQYEPSIFSEIIETFSGNFCVVDITGTVELGSRLLKPAVIEAQNQSQLPREKIVNCCSSADIQEGAVIQEQAERQAYEKCSRFQSLFKPASMLAYLSSLR